MKISFLIQNVYGIGGTNRTVLNLAEGLSAHHEVEIVSVFRRQHRMSFDPPSGVVIRPLVDLRPGAAGADRGNPLLAEPSELVPRAEEFYAQYSRLTDERIREFLTGSDADVVVGTRSSLNLLVARFGREGAVRVAQEHMSHLAIPRTVRAEYQHHYPRLDAITTVTEADARTFASETPVPGVPVVAIPNSVFAARVAPADHTAETIVAAGRLQPLKRYDLLVGAFALLADEFPSWRLRIYGQGPEKAPLRGLITELGLTERVLLMGSAAPLDPEWVKGSIAAVTSSEESFGMTVVEAMRCGLPVVSTDCPVGPREIIRDGEDGLLVANGDVEAVAKGLSLLMGDPALRAAMGKAALENSGRYDPALVAERYADLFRERARARGLGLGLGLGHATGAAVPGGGAASTARRRPDPVGNVTVSASGALTLEVEHAPVKGSVAWIDLVETSPKDTGRVVRLPATITPASVPGTARLTVRLPAGEASGLADGRWSVTLESRLGRRRKVRAGVLDTRALIARRTALLTSPEDTGEHGGAGDFHWLAPYRTAGGYLSVRCWSVDTHAECTEVDVRPSGITVGGVVLGRGVPAPSAALVLERRGAHAGEVIVPQGVVAGRRFRFELPVSRCVDLRLGRWEDWDWWLAPEGPAGPRVRIGRYVEDFVEKKTIFEYECATVTDEDPSNLVVQYPSPQVEVRPFCTAAGGMSMNVVDRA